jgi:hypothetical protein
MSDRLATAQLADDYGGLANRLLDVCGYATLDAVISAALSRESWRMPLMQLEKRMFEAMRFREANPWCVAYPWLVSDVFETMHQKFPAPIIQVEGKLKANSYFPELNQDATNFMSEVGLELMLQAWALQLLEVPPATTAPEGTIQCGFRYFDIENVCPHQIADGCPGWFKPADGSPHPADLSDEDTLLGCPFEKVLALKGVAVTSIKLPEHNERNNAPMR